MRWGVLRLPLLVAAALLPLSCSPDDPRTSQAPALPRTVRVAHADLRLIERTLQVVGTLLPHDEATISAQVAGQIERIHVDIGDRVAAGQVVALIDTTSYEALVRQSAANLARATAGAANAVRSLERIRDLRQEQIASDSELDQAVAEADQASAEVEAARAADAIVRLNLERSRVKAPFSGAIARRIASAGDYVGIGAPIVRLVQADPLRLRLEVPERESVEVRVGQPVRVTVEGAPDVHTGRIARVAPAIRETDRTLSVEADVPNPGALRAGLFARAEIVVNESDSGVTVPAAALLGFAGLEKIVVVLNGKAAERTVTTGRRIGDRVEIVSGLGTGETVVLDPAGIRTGQILTIDDEAPAPPAGPNSG